MASRQLRYGLIGCGRISANHLRAAVANGLEFVALCDTEDEALAAKQELCAQLADEAGAQQPGPRLYRDYREMLNAEDLDLIAICTESGKHATIALDCIEAGVNLIIEKPIALSLADTDAIIECAEVKGVKVCACHQNRFNRSIQALRAALEAGRFGRLFYATAHIRWNRGLPYYEQAPWRGTWEQDGGALMNQCIHNIDLLRWMMGDEITEVFAYTDRLAHDFIEAEDLGLALVRFANGAYGLIEGTTDVYPANLEETLYVFGSEGTVKAGGTSVNTIEHWAFADGADDPEQVMREANEQPNDVYGFGHTPLYADVVAAIQEDRPPAIDARAGRNALELVLAIYKSARDGAPVKLPLKDFSTLDMRGTFS
ncbi:MAG: Gfo/Idh/MocA family oxidoreductase [Coriobacteriales bacterium]|jgi:predicted dehydrogenase|nr:Gfo/Idh/MocA family oxidoreductase [Coriobacteriales bacterium]